MPVIGGSGANSCGPALVRSRSNPHTICPNALHTSQEGLTFVHPWLNLIAFRGISRNELGGFNDKHGSD